MQSAELKFVRFDSRDVIVTSGPVSEFLTLANFGDDQTGNATVTGYFKGKNINYTNTSDNLATYLQGLYGGNYYNVAAYFTDTTFKFGDGERDAFSKLSSAVTDEYYYDAASGPPYGKFNGTYTYDTLLSMFVKQPQ